jgi:hypothetical protein
MKEIALRSESSPVNFGHQSFRALPSIFPFFMNSATNTQETADVQTEIGATANAEVLQGVGKGSRLYKNKTQMPSRKRDSFVLPDTYALCSFHDIALSFLMARATRVDFPGLKCQATAPGTDDREPESEGAKSLMIFDTQTDQVVGNRVHDVKTEPKTGQVSKFETYSAEYVGTGRY